MVVKPSGEERQCHIVGAGKVYVYAFTRPFYPKRLTNEDITLQLTSKLTISYVKGNPSQTLSEVTGVTV